MQGTGAVAGAPPAGFMRPGGLCSRPCRGGCVVRLVNQRLASSAFCRAFSAASWA